jgi:hypothetical protein
MNSGVREADQPSPQQKRLEQSQAHSKSQVALSFFACQLVRIPTHLPHGPPEHLSSKGSKARNPEQPSHNID